MCIKHLQKGNLTYEYNMPFFVNVFGLIFVFLYPTMGCFLMYFPEFCLVNLVGADANLDSPAKKALSTVHGGAACLLAAQPAVLVRIVFETMYIYIYV